MGSDFFKLVYAILQRLSQKMRWWKEWIVEHLDFRVVWGNAKAYQTIWRRQGLIHVYSGIGHLLQHAICGVEARWP